ncbi:serine/arginine-rich splicing factor RS2Z33 isoform X2 [Ixodes scapularis]|uniref:serine/arginine-rich splicing factor RS2Z33 isoform X2 n=1 Tax=Ixodes scapularis TaxID=6945 RepID=UPI0011617BB1|nr:serine/arginine-rich splicing factor RS2Z33 isoform X2 [Ixodes scapularis]
MSGRGQLFIGRLPLECRERDVEQVFERYGRLLRCDVKYGTGMAYAFVDYEDHRDAEDAVKYENGREIRGQSVVVEWARGPSFRPPAAKVSSFDECYRCRRTGHWARDCPEGDSRERPYYPSRRSRSRSRSRSRTPQRSYRRSRHSRSRSRSSSRRRSWSRSPSPRDSRERQR